MAVIVNKSMTWIEKGREGDGHAHGVWPFRRGVKATAKRRTNTKNQEKHEWGLSENQPFSKEALEVAMLTRWLRRQTTQRGK